MAGPLAGMTVVDLTHVMAGPFCTHVLGLLGAEIIKIERPGEGDVFRHYDRRPEFVGMAPAFQTVNVGKKSITLDLKCPGTRLVFAGCVHHQCLVVLLHHTFDKHEVFARHHRADCSH